MRHLVFGLLLQGSLRLMAAKDEERRRLLNRALRDRTYTTTGHFLTLFSRLQNLRSTGQTNIDGLSPFPQTAQTEFLGTWYAPYSIDFAASVSKGVSILGGSRFSTASELASSV